MTCKVYDTERGPRHKLVVAIEAIDLPHHTMIKAILHKALTDLLGGWYDAPVTGHWQGNANPARLYTMTFANPGLLMHLREAFNVASRDMGEVWRHGEFTACAFDALHDQVLPTPFV